MNFLTQKVLEYQQKKLVEAKANLQSHVDKMEKLSLYDSDNFALENEEKLIKIWSQNVNKIEKEIAKIKEKTN
ncbi:MAG: hypothetical protein K5793_08535 [Nitrosarchaeum sp.]|nr:hypothetical protein [Nitrosarchaeum sp.]